MSGSASTSGTGGAAPAAAAGDATTVGRLARWAHGLQPEDIGTGNRERALLQQLSAAGALRALRDWAVLAPFPEDEPGMAAGRIGWLALGDRLLGSSGSAAAVTAGWAMAQPGVSLGRRLVATVAANAVSAREGLATGALEGAPGVGPRTEVAAAVVAGGLVRGLSARQLAHALALGLSTVPAVAPDLRWGPGVARVRAGALPVRLGLEAVELAAQGVTGPCALLDRVDGGPSGCHTPLLRAAFTALGETWLSETLGFALEPVAPGVDLPAQAVHEILRRHVKAADKRLRTDQVAGIEVRAAAPVVAQADRAGRPLGPLDPGQIPGSIPLSIALRVASHDSGPGALRPAALAPLAERVAAVAATVSVHHDPARTAALLAHQVEVLAPLWAGLSPRALRRLLRPLDPRGPAGVGGLVAALRHRPDRLLARVRRAEPGLSGLPVGAWRDRRDTEVLVHTTRGGHWPERRELPEGSPGWPWQDTVDRLCARHAGDDPDRAAGARALLAAEDRLAAPEFCAALLA